jgi:hypothetical protein
MTRRTAYFSALKYHFATLMLERAFNHGALSPADRRACYTLAKKRAAEYTFNLSTHSLTTCSIEVW